MIIGIDARFWGLENTGIGRYVMELGGELIARNDTDTIVLFLRQKYFSELKFKSPRIKKVLADVSHYSLAEQIKMPGLIDRAGVEIMHFPHFNVPIFYRGRFVVTIHDLIKHFSKGAKTTTRAKLFYWLKYLGYKLVVRFALKRSARVIVPSRWWQAELVRRYGIEKSKIRVVYEAVSNGFKKQSLAKVEEVVKKFSLPESYLVYTGNLYPHKNVMTAVKGLLALGGKSKLKLVLVCARNSFTQRFITRVRELGSEKKIRLVGFVSDLELGAILQGAMAYVFPSRLEGFGLPGLEAMAVGTPVLAARASCLPEIYGKAALYFDPDRPDELVRLLQKLIGNEKLRNELRHRGFAQLKKYSWSKAARETYEIYRQVAQK